MMNDETEQFERRLSRLSLRQIPGEWRGEIMAAARDGQASRDLTPVTHRSLLLTICYQLSTVLWPHPKAWAALATIWILILVVNFSTGDKTPVVVEKVTPSSPEVMVELKKQQLLFAELMGPRETLDADRQKIFSPKPRSEYVEILAA
jgi:hypothetical protein